MSFERGGSRATARRILVVANETVTGDVLHAVVRSRAAADGRVEVLVVAPALNSRLRHWISDVDGARRGAEQRLQLCLDRLAVLGLDAKGLVGDSDPLQAIEDSLKLFAADEIIILDASGGAVALARARSRPPGP